MVLSPRYDNLSRKRKTEFKSAVHRLKVDFLSYSAYDKEVEYVYIL